MVARCARCERLFALAEKGPVRCPECGAALWAGEAEPPSPPSQQQRPEPSSPPPQQQQRETEAEAGWFEQPPRPKHVVAPWEVQGAPAVERFLATVRLVMMAPRAFFARLDPEGEAGITLFAWLCVTPPVAAWALAGLLQVAGMDASPLADDPAWADTPLARLETLRSLYLGLLAAAPIIGLMAVHVAAGLYHVGLTLAAGSGRPYTATFRAAVFGMAPMLLLAVPLIGPPVAIVWTGALHTIALSRLHGIAGSLAALIVVVMWSVFGMVALMVLSAFVSAAGWAPQATG